MGTLEVAGVSIFGFEQVNAGWEETFKNEKIAKYSACKCMSNVNNKTVDW